MHEQQILFRAPTMDDAPRVYELIQRCDIADYGEPDTELEDLTFDWQRADLSRDAWLALAPADDLVGYALVESGHAGLQYDVYVEPSWPEREPERALLGRCQVRGSAIASEQGAALIARIYVSDVNRQKCETVQEAGFEIARYHWQMQIALDPPPPEPVWPAGISVRTAIIGQDDQAIHTLVETTFARPGRTPTTLDEWRELMMMGPDVLEPELWFLALHEGQIVGVCLAFTYPALGWVRQLAVAAA